MINSITRNKGDNKNDKPYHVKVCMWVQVPETQIRGPHIMTGCPPHSNEPHNKI